MGIVQVGACVYVIYDSSPLQADGIWMEMRSTPLHLNKIVKDSARQANMHDHLLSSSVMDLVVKFAFILFSLCS